MNLRSSPTTGQLRAIGKLFSSDGDSETKTQKFANREARVTQALSSKRPAAALLFQLSLARAPLVSSAAHLLQG